MKVVIIGGTGLIGRKLATKLQSAGHDVVAASPSTGVNSFTGEGLKKALTGANVVVEVTNSPSFEDNAVLEFFRRSTEHLLSAAAAAGVSHYIALDREHQTPGLRLGRDGIAALRLVAVFRR